MIPTPSSSSSELLGGLEQPRREAGGVQQPPEVVARIREVRVRGGGDAAGVDPAEDRRQPRREDVRDVRLRLLQGLWIRSSLRRAPAGARRRRSSRSAGCAASPSRPARSPRRPATRSTWRSTRPRSAVVAVARSHRIPVPGRTAPVYGPAMALRARTFTYAVTLDRDWTAASDRGGTPDSARGGLDARAPRARRPCTRCTLRACATTRSLRGLRAALAGERERRHHETRPRRALRLRRDRRRARRVARACAGRRPRAARAGGARLLHQRVAHDRARVPVDGQRRGRRSERHPARRRGRPRALLRARPAAGVPRRPRRDPVPGRGDRRDRGVPARGQREHRRAVRDEHPHDGADRAGAGRRGTLARLPSRRGRVRAEHDLAQLPVHARVRADARARRRDPRHEARPRRQRRAVARARARPRRRRRASSRCTTT